MYFDDREFGLRKAVKHVDLAYQAQAHEIIRLFRLITTHSPSSQAEISELTAIFEVAQQALNLAHVEKTDTSSVPGALATAVDRLTQYSRKYDLAKFNDELGPHRIDQKFATAKENDTQAVAEAKGFMAQAKKAFQRRGDPIKVLCSIWTGLPVKNASPPPPLIPLELDAEDNLDGLIYFLSCHKEPKLRITLLENPHFYSERQLSGSVESDAYHSDFESQPLKTLKLQAPSMTLHVLRDRSARTVLKYDGTAVTFGNIWRPRVGGPFIMKDAQGILKSADLVRRSIGSQAEATWRCTSLGDRTLQWGDVLQEALRPSRGDLLFSSGSDTNARPSHYTKETPKTPVDTPTSGLPNGKTGSVHGKKRKAVRKFLCFG